MGHFSSLHFCLSRRLWVDLTLKWQVSPPGSRNKVKNRTGLPASRGGGVPGSQVSAYTRPPEGCLALQDSVSSLRGEGKRWQMFLSSCWTSGWQSPSPHGPAEMNHPSGCSLPAVTSHPRTATSFPASVCPSSDWLRGDGGDSFLHMFTKCQVPGSLQAIGITAASISPPTMTPALALPCLWAQDLPANTYTSFPEGSFWPFRVHFREIEPLSWPSPHPCPQPAAFHNSIPILFLPSGRMTLRLVLQCPEFPGGMKKRLVPTVVAWLAAFLPISLPHPLPLLPGVTFHINYLHLDPGLTVCFCGNADQDRNTETEFTDGDKRWGGRWSRSQGRNPERGPLTRPGSG